MWLDKGMAAIQCYRISNLTTFLGIEKYMKITVPMKIKEIGL